LWASIETGRHVPKLFQSRLRIRCDVADGEDEGEDGALPPPVPFSVSSTSAETKPCRYGPSVPLMVACLFSIVPLAMAWERGHQGREGNG